MNSNELSIQPFEVITRLDRQALVPFLAVAALWLIASLALSARFSGGHVGLALTWVGFLWAFSLFDLYSLSRAAGAALGLASTTGENRGALIIQAFYWGVIKLTCLGILGAILSYGRAIPVSSLLTGSGTLVVVPLLGGYLWSQRVLRHA